MAMKGLILNYLFLLKRMLPIYQAERYTYENEIENEENHNYIKNARATMYIIEGCAGNAEVLGPSCIYLKIYILFNRRR